MYLTESDFKLMFMSVRLDEIAMPGGGLFAEQRRRGWVDLRQYSAQQSSGKWQRRFVVLAGAVLYVLPEPSAEPVIVLPLRSVRAVKVAGKVDGKDAVLAIEPSDNATVIEYSERVKKATELRKVRQLSIGCADSALRDRWIDDIKSALESVQPAALPTQHDDASATIALSSTEETADLSLSSDTNSAVRDDAPKKRGSHGQRHKKGGHRRNK